MTQAPPVVVTRPAAQAELWAEQLRSQGLTALALPLIEIAPVLAPSDLRACWQRLPDYAALVFVSGNAVDHFFNGQAPAWPANVRCLAPGPGTGQRLRECGVPGSCIDEPAPDAPQFDSESLWQVIGERSWSGRRVLVVSNLAPRQFKHGVSHGMLLAASGGPRGLVLASVPDDAAPGTRVK